MPDWSDILDLNLVNVSWTLPFLIGTVCVAVHLVWTWQRWRAAVALQARHSTQAAAFWFFRQDALNVVVGTAMTLGGVFAILRFVGWPVWCLLIGAMAFMVNKIWNLADDRKVQSFIRRGMRSRSPSS
jgi:hypothetical protein